MVHDIGTDMAQRLDLLAQRGERHLRMLARRAAWARAVELALLASPVVPVAFLAARALGPVGPVVMPVAALAVPMLVLLAAYRIARTAQPPGRARALALYDHHLGLKDRIVAADEFAALPVRGGFHDAALHEAAAAIDRALATPLTIAPPHPAAAIARRRWPFGAAALAILLLAAAIPEAAPSPGARLAGTFDRIMAGRAAPRAADPARDAGGGTAPNAVPPAPGAGTGAGTIPDDGRNGVPGAGAAGRAGVAGRDSAGTSARATPPAAGAAGDSARPGADMRAQGAGRAGDMPARSAATAAGERIDATGANPADAPGREAATAPRPGATPGGTPPSAAAGSAAPPAPPRPAPSKGEKTGAGQQDRSRKGEKSNASQPGQGDGQGQNGQRGGGVDALKKSRGVSGLLLAVPMQDRLVGTLNDGPVESITRRGTPRAAPRAAADAAARGTGAGTVGRIPRRAPTAQERRLLETYFARGAAS